MVDCLLLFASFKNIKLTESSFQMNGCKIRPIININQLSMARPIPIFETFKQRSLINKILSICRPQPWWLLLQCHVPLSFKSFIKNLITIVLHVPRRKVTMIHLLPVTCTCTYHITLKWLLAVPLENLSEINTWQKSSLKMLVK